MSDGAKISFQCSLCGKSLSVPSQHAGKFGKCPGCQQKLTVPQLPAEAELSPTDAWLQADTPPSGSDPLADPYLLNDASSSGNSGLGCSHCGATMQPGAVICLQCGFDARKGTVLQTASSSSSHCGLKLKARKSRVYVHKKCGTGTEISDQDFLELCNPFEVCLATICTSCGPVKLDTVAWADTNETIKDYRERVGAVLSSQLPGLSNVQAGLVSGGLLFVVSTGTFFYYRSMENPHATWSLLAFLAPMSFALGFVGGMFAGFRGRSAEVYRYCRKHGFETTSIT